MVELAHMLKYGEKGDEGLVEHAERIAALDPQKKYIFVSGNTEGLENKLVHSSAETIQIYFKGDKEQKTIVSVHEANSETLKKLTANGVISVERSAELQAELEDALRAKVRREIPNRGRV